MLKNTAFRLKTLIIATTMLALTGCETMKDNPGGTAAGTAVITGALCKAMGGTDKECVGAAVVAGGITYLYLRSQLEEIQTIENVEARECVANDPNRQAYCVTMDSNAVNFESGSANISRNSANTLNQVADVIKQSPDTLVYIEGHTDTDGSASYNQWLSEQRALSVQGAFQKQGIDGGRMQSLGYGETQPAYDDVADPTKKPLNRRVEIRVEGGEGGES
ncbi:OmpA family protein [Hahella ganghwensis]|uniref:OmpA family protein n=1 Tax=Hahella ganghwensis TaxID=286420 RepID=UPI00035E4471|nr:OmpA family protein [Hahella ganghwensis]